MKISVTGRHVVVTPELQSLIGRKLEKLDRMLHDSAVSAQVVLSRERNRCVAEVVLHVRGDHMLHGDAQGSDWSQAVAGAVEKVDQQAHTLKGKWEDRRRRASSAPTPGS